MPEKKVTNQICIKTRLLSLLTTVNSDDDDDDEMIENIDVCTTIKTILSYS